MTEQTNFVQSAPADETQDVGGITLHDILRMVIANWYWFALSMIVCVALGYFYLASTPRIYSRTATILIKDSRKGGDIEMTAFNDLAGLQSRRNVDNEVFILQSRRLMAEVIDRLNLTTDYIIRGTLRDRDLYGQSPVEVEFVDDNAEQRLSMQLTPRGENQFELTAFADGFLSSEEAKRILPGNFGDTIATPFGHVIVRKTYYMSPAYDGKPIQVIKSSLATATSRYRSQVRCEVANKLSSIVQISMSNSVPKRAEDVINMLITVYNDDAINDKRQISVSTSNFIKERLQLISRELGDVDRDVEQLKRDNKMVDISSEAGRNVAESSHYKTEGLSLENQIRVSEFIRSYLNDPANAKELIPMMASVTNSAISSQIDEYNEAVLHRAKLIENSSERSPVIQDMDNRLATVRRSIISSLSSHISTLELQRQALQQQEVQATHLGAPDPGEGPARHHAPAEDQGGALPLPAQQAGGDPAQLRHRGEQLAHHRPRLRQQRPRIAPPAHDPGRRPRLRLRHSVRTALPDRHARHHDPQPPRRRGASERPLPRRHSVLRRIGDRA